MTDSASSPSLHRAVRRAVRHIQRHGLNGPRPIEQIEVLASDLTATVATIAAQLEDVADEELAALVHLARLLRLSQLTEPIADRVLRRAAPLAAKIEAIDMLREGGVEIPASVEQLVALANDFLANPDAAKIEQVVGLADPWRMPILREWLTNRPSGNASMWRHVVGIDGALDEAVVSRLADAPDAEAIAALRAIGDTADKPLRKLARRTLHRLRSSGVEVQPREAIAGSPFSLDIVPDTRGEASAFMTGIDGNGGRIAWLLAPSPKGGLRLLEAVVDDSEGLHKAEVLTVTRTGFREHLQRLRSNPGILVAQTTLEHVASVVQAAAELSRSAGTELPAAYSSWCDDFAAALFDEPPASAPAAPIYEQISLQQVREDPDALRESSTLLGEPAFANWAFGGPAAEQAARGVRSAETSQLVVDDEQRKQQVENAIGAVAEAFDAGLRACYRQRLEEMSLALWTTKRRDLARLALAAAVGFTEIDDLYSDHPFARALIQRGVMVAYQSVRENEEQPESESRIVRP